MREIPFDIYSIISFVHRVDTLLPVYYYNMEEDNNIRAGGNRYFYGPGSVCCKGQRKMAANC